MTAQQLPCPTCGRLTPISSARHLPFCSDRCRLIDLGRWLDEEHTLPVAPTDDEEASQAAATDPKPSESPGGRYDEPEERKPVRLPPGWHDA